MVTVRARILIAVSTTGMVLGVLTGQSAIAVLGLAVLAWLLGEWILFRLRSEVVWRSIRFERDVTDDRGPARTLWVDRHFQVRIRVHLPRTIGLLCILVRDREPSAVERVSGEAETEPVIHSRSVTIEYGIRPRSAGAVEFAGVSLQMADLQGFFYAERFLANRQTYRVLPALVQSGAVPQQVKRYNLLPPPGKHRHLRPGTGSELLQLREYVPGDPLKSIAWRVSARRGILMSKDFESEVPVRCTLFLDASNSVRVGHPHATPLARLVELAAAIAQLALAERDPVGLCAFDEQGSRVLEPAAGRRQANQLLAELADVAARPPDPVRCPVEQPLAAAFSLCEELYPTLLRNKLNRVPFRLFPVRRSKRLQQHRRIRMATVLAQYFDLGPSEPVRLMHDDRLMADWCQRFLGVHQVGYDGPLYDEQGRYVFASPDKIDVLARAITRSVRKGHDNELFVILADLLELSDQLAPLLTAIKVALARHHRVVILSAWPPGLEPPTSTSAGLRTGATVRTVAKREKNATPEEIAGFIEDIATGSTLRSRGRSGAAADLLSVVRRADRYRFHTAYAHLRRAMGRLHVPVISAAQSRATQLILDELDLLRTARGRR